MTQQYGSPEESINAARVNRIRKVARYFLKRFSGSRDYDIRFVLFPYWLIGRGLKDSMERKLTAARSQTCWISTVQ